LTDDSAALLARNPVAVALEDSPALKAYVQCFLDTFVVHGRLDPVLRQLTILRIAWRCGQAYEWARHYARAVDVGVSDADVLSVRSDDPSHIASCPVRMAAVAADEVVDLGYMRPETFARCAAHFANPGLTQEFLYLVAGYRMMTTVLNTNRPSLSSAGLPLWPPDGVGPHDGP
jgi:4-carboxymuconolactone decarboxylase